MNLNTGKEHKDKHIIALKPNTRKRRKVNRIKLLQRLLKGMEPRVWHQRITGMEMANLTILCSHLPEFRGSVLSRVNTYSNSELQTAEVLIIRNLLVTRRLVSLEPITKGGI